MRKWLEKNCEKIGTSALIILAAIVVWSVFGTLSDFYKYVRLNYSTEAKLIDLAVEKIKEDRYALAATYTFSVNGHLFQGSSLMQDPLFRNPSAAESYKKNAKYEPFIIFYDAKDPQVSSAGKHFPVKQAIYAFILIFIFIYFLMFRRFLVKK